MYGRGCRTFDVEAVDLVEDVLHEVRLVLQLDPVLRVAVGREFDALEVGVGMSQAKKATLAVRVATGGYVGHVVEERVHDARRVRVLRRVTDVARPEGF